MKWDYSEILSEELDEYIAKKMKESKREGGEHYILVDFFEDHDYDNDVRLKEFLFTNHPELFNFEPNDKDRPLINRNAILSAVGHKFMDDLGFKGVYKRNKEQKELEDQKRRIEMSNSKLSRILLYLSIGTGIYTFLDIVLNILSGGGIIQVLSRMVN